MEREEFIVPRANVPSLKSSNGCVLVMRAEKLFSCSVEVSDNGDALGEWVTVLGEKENARRAMDYILAGCEEQEGMNIPFTADLLDEPSGTFFERLEYSSCAVVSVRRNGYINIRGSPVAMATALSIIQCHQAESSASTPVPMSSSRSSTSTPVPVSSSRSSTSTPVPMSSSHSSTSAPVPVSSSRSSASTPVPMSSSRSSAVDTSPTGKHTPSQQAGDSKTCSLATSSYQPVHNDGLQVHSRVSQQASSQSKPQLACSFSKPSKPVSARTETVKQKPTVSPSPSMPHSSAHAVISTLSSTTNLSPIHVHPAATTTTTSGTTTATGSGAVSSLMLPSDVSVWQAVSIANASSSVATVSTSSMNRTSMTNDDNSSHARKHKCGAADAATAASTPTVVGNAERQSIASASSTPVGMSRTDAATSTAVTTAGRGAATSTAITTASAAASTAGRSASAAGAGSAGSAKRSLWDMSVCSTGSSSSRAATNSRNTASQVVNDDMSLALSCLPKPSALSSYGPSTTPGTQFQAVGAHGTSKYDLTTASTSAMPHDNSATYDTTYSAGASSSNTSSRSTNQEKSLWVSAISDGARGGGSQSSTPSFDSSTPLPYYANASTKTSSHSSSASGVTGVSGGSGRHAAAASHSNTNAGGRSPRPAASTGSAGKHGVAHKKPHKQSHLASANASSYPAGTTAPAHHHHHHHASGGGYQAHPLSYMPSTGASGTGLRPVIIDGSNIAMSHGKHEIFSCRGILLAVKFFQERGHLNIRAMIPTSVFRTNHAKPVRNKEILEHLRKCDHLTETPSRLVNGRLIVPYDDRFILQVAQGNGGVVVSNDQYRDLIGEEQFRVIIETRLVSFIFVDDLFLPAKDPLGRSGPTLDAMLQF